MSHCKRVLDASAAGKSCAVVSGVVYVICAAAYAIIPDATLAFFNLLFHGLDIRKVAIAMTWGGVIGGFIITVIGAYVLTGAWAALYNRMSGGHAAEAHGTGSKDCCA
ncbi:hypothetical protein HY635_02115 [Candidatus Uhrbacteria bacterium]|nr:hypothetical protein [Candidatus Uhrbacteria bacterium]